MKGLGRERGRGGGVRGGDGLHSLRHTIFLTLGLRHKKKNIEEKVAGRRW